MAFKKDKDSAAATPAAKPAGAPAKGQAAAKTANSDRLWSLDAYRGLTMLFLASGGLGIRRMVERNPDILGRFGPILQRQLDHVAWTGCAAWDLIQPSFMFMVGAAMPFSFAKRAERGDSWLSQFLHALSRSVLLILLGIFLRSTGKSMTYFTFEDVVTQIGLGYLIVFILLRTGFWLQLAAVLAILGGYWFYFYHHPLPPPEGNAVTRYLTEVAGAPASAWNQFTGVAAHWNKHTNAAAEFDRWFLNLFPREGTAWEGKKFWVNGGGYHTLNFVPSMATMLFGVMAGQLLLGGRPNGEKLRFLLIAGAVCFAAAFAVDTTIWPFGVSKLTYSYCPVVKRIWTPSWAVFSAGWVFWILAAFYWIVDMRGFRRLAFPLVIVGMNSILVYCIVEELSGWIVAMLKIHARAFDAVAHTKLVDRLFGESPWATVWLHLAVVLVIWLFCLWLYRRRLFVRI